VAPPPPRSAFRCPPGNPFPGANPKAHAINMHAPDSAVKSGRHPALTAREALALRDAISPSRLTTYLRRAHRNVRLALDLYEWNVTVGAALYPILQTNEVTLRNAVERALSSQFGGAWPYAPGFLRSLPERDRAVFEAGVRRVERTLGVARAATGDVVANQTYWFWVNLLTSRFEQRIWSREFGRAFPYAPRGVDRAVLHGQADSLRRLRNRIAHHEPLLDVDVGGAYRRAAAMVRWISPEKAAWAESRWFPPAQAPR
jgi:hypothetical protein